MAQESREKENREKEIKSIWSDYHFLFRMLVGVGVAVFGLLVGRFMYTQDEAWEYGVNVFTGLISTAATVLILDELNRRRLKKEVQDSLKIQLVDDAASLSNEIAKNAVHQLRRKGRLVGEASLLKGAYLWHANLQDADLTDANLQKAYLSFGNLEGAYLLRTNLEEAQLVGANLQKAYLSGANLKAAILQGADLHEAYLEGTNLRKANLSSTRLQGAHLAYANLEEAFLATAELQGANLAFANLKEVKLGQTKFDGNTVLPDGSPWTPETDMERFADPQHPNFWQPEWIKRSEDKI